MPRTKPQQIERQITKIDYCHIVFLRLTLARRQRVIGIHDIDSIVWWQLTACSCHCRCNWNPLISGLSGMLQSNSDERVCRCVSCYKDTIHHHVMQVSYNLVIVVISFKQHISNCNQYRYLLRRGNQSSLALLKKLCCCSRAIQ